MTNVSAITVLMLMPIKPGDLLVLRRRAHRDAELRPVDESEQPGHHHHRRDDDHDLHVGDRRAVRGCR